MAESLVINRYILLNGTMSDVAITKMRGVELYVHIDLAYSY